MGPFTNSEIQVHTLLEMIEQKGMTLWPRFWYSLSLSYFFPSYLNYSASCFKVIMRFSASCNKFALVSSCLSNFSLLSSADFWLLDFWRSSLNLIILCSAVLSALACVSSYFLLLSSFPWFYISVNLVSDAFRAFPWLANYFFNLSFF